LNLAEVYATSLQDGAPCRLTLFRRPEFARRDILLTIGQNKLTERRRPF